LDQNNRIHTSMKTRIALTALTLLVLSAGVQPVQAIEDLRLQVQGTNAVLSWPSTQNETFIVRYRARLDEAHPWTTLTNNYPAASGTNRTVFIHVGVVEYPTGGGGGGGGGGNPPAPEGASTGEDDSDTDKIEWPPLPPMPWDPRWIRDPSESGGALTEDGGGEVPLGAIGFYQVVRHGIHLLAHTGGSLFAVTNGTVLSGSQPFVIEVGFDGWSDFRGLTVSADDQPVIGFEFLDSSDGVLRAVWETASVSNDVYELLKAAEFGTDTVAGDPVSVIVANEIWFPNQWPVAGDSMRLEVQTVHANGYWEMDFYNEHGQFLGWLYGDVDGDGYCNLDGFPGPGFSVSLVDEFDEQLPWNAYVVEVFVWPDGFLLASSSPATAVTTNVVERRWFFNTRYAVSYQQIFNPNSLNGLILQAMMQNVAGAAEARRSGDPIRGSSQVPWELPNAAAWDSLRQDLTNHFVRDFFYFGHGSANSFGSGGAGTRITVSDLQTMLGNTKNPMVGTNRHPYRFVFLDGCKTAAGGLPEAFGIPKGNVGFDEFWPKRGMRARAFVGWPNTVLFAWGGVDTAHTEGISRFYQHWATIDPGTQQPMRLDDAIDRATKNQSGNVIWSKGQKLVMHGYHGLGFWE
jgi:hypothetical protein